MQEFIKQCSEHLIIPFAIAIAPLGFYALYDLWGMQRPRKSTWKGRH